MLPILTYTGVKKARFLLKQNLASEEGDEKLMITVMFKSESVHIIQLYICHRLDCKHFFNKKKELYENVHFSREYSSF